MKAIAFHGGTALRFLYRLPRYSEDPNFALDLVDERYDCQRYLLDIRRVFEREGHCVEVKANDRRTVHSAFVRFRRRT